MKETVKVKPYSPVCPTCPYRQGCNRAGEYGVCNRHPDLETNRVRRLNEVMKGGE